MSLPIDHRAGTQLGPFVLGNVVGQGGMGVVYSATKRDTGETVAIKLMSPELSSSEEFRQRFLNEAAVGPIIDHPNVVPIYGSGDVDGELYISMKLIEGRNLKEVLKEEGALEPKRALRIFRQVASALDAAHESGMVHRDIKPQNILLATDDGQHDLAYVSDFGLVKPMSSDTSASRTGQVFGSLPYMAPEQIEAMEMDGRADVYALACVLFETLTGKPPFERPNEVAVVWAHVHEVPPFATELRRDLPGGVDGVVMQAMSKHPDDRFLTCGEFVEAFEQGLGQQRSRISRAMRPLVARTERPKTEREVWGPNFFPELSRIRKVQRKVDWVRAAVTVGVLSLAGLSVTQLAHPQGLSGAASDVSDVVKSATDGVVQLVTDEVEQRARQADQTREVGLARSSGPVSFGLGSRRSTVADVGTRPRTNLGSDSEGPQSSASVALGDPSLDSTLVLFWSDEDEASSASGMAGDIFAIRANGEGRERIISGPGDDSDPDISVNDKIVFTSQRAGEYDLFVSNLDGSGIKRLTTTPDLCEWDPNWSPDGNKIAYTDSCWYSNTSSNQGDILVMDSDGTGITNLTRSPRLDEGWSDWSPDGSKIVFISGPYAGPYDVNVMNSDGTGRTVLTSDAEFERGPVWSPDGTKIAFFERTGAGSIGETDIFVINADGTGERRLTDAIGRDERPHWSPDGKKILYLRRDGDTFHTYIMDADGSNGQRLTQGFPMSWQPAHFRRLMIEVEDGIASGLLVGDYGPCVRQQSVSVQRRTGVGWRTVARSATDSHGRFRIDMDADRGAYRAKSPFLVGPRGELCSSAVSDVARAF